MSMQASALQRCLPFTTQRPKRGSHKSDAPGQFCSCHIGIQCQAHARHSLQTCSHQSCSGVACNCSCHKHSERSFQSKCNHHKPGCKGHGCSCCTCRTAALACTCRRDRLTCRAHGSSQLQSSKPTKTNFSNLGLACGCRADGFKCHVHSSSSNPGHACGCRADGFKCHAHSASSTLGHACGCRADGFKCHAHSPSEPAEGQSQDSRRRLLQSMAGLAAASVLLRQQVAVAAGQPQPEPKVLCESDCQAKLAEIKEVKTASGLRYKDLVVGKGPTPPTGYQIVADYVAMTPDGKVFDSSLDRGRPYDLRVGSGQIVAGLDEGVSGMRAGGLRRIYVPGNLSFPKGLPSGPGRPRVPPASPVMFDVKLLFIPGLEDEEE